MAESEDPEQDVEESRSGEEPEERDEQDGADEDGADESDVDRDADPERGEDDEAEDAAEDSDNDDTDSDESESDSDDDDGDRDGEPEDDAEPASEDDQSDDDEPRDDEPRDDEPRDDEPQDDAEPDDEEPADDGATDDLLEERYERLGPEALIDRYRPVGLATGTPWTWSSLSPAETDALVEMIDSFVADYNEVWALADDDTIPPCWHRHPALAHDLAALTWAYYQAYLDPAATPELALRFQAHLPKFRGRLDDWLGADPAACRDNSHSRTWRRSTRPAPPAATRDSSEERDAVVLLGYRLWGFPRPDRSPPD